MWLEHSKSETALTYSFRWRGCIQRIWAACNVLSCFLKETEISLDFISAQRVHETKFMATFAEGMVVSYEKLTLSCTELIVWGSNTLAVNTLTYEGCYKSRLLSEIIRCWHNLEVSLLHQYIFFALSSLTESHFYAAYSYFDIFSKISPCRNWININLLKCFIGKASIFL